MNFWQDLRRRRIYRLAGVYIVGAWIAIQVADVVFPAWGISTGAIRIFVVAAVTGFPIALVFGWFFDITSEGVVRTSAKAKYDSSLRRIDYLILLALVAVSIAVLYGSFQKILETSDDVSEVISSIDKPEHSIAVLPFVNLNDDSDTEYFSDGVTEEILHRLAAIKELQVLGRTSSFAFKNSEIGASRISDILRVRYLLTGSVRRESGAIRITASLVDESGFQVWSESFDRKMEDVFAIQSDIANLVAGQLVKEIITPDAPFSGRATTNIDAYNFYLIGRDYINRRPPNWQGDGAVAFRKSIDLDPSFALPYAGIAIALVLDRNGDYLSDADAAAERSQELDPDLAEAHAAKGLVLLRGQDPDYVESEFTLRRALELDPNLVMAYSWLANALYGQGRIDEGNAVVDKAQVIDPLNPVVTVNAARKSSRKGDFRRAEKLLLRLVELPEPPGLVYWGLRNLSYNYGRLSEALHWSQQTVLNYRDSNGFGFLALDYERLGMSDEADYWIGRLAGIYPNHTVTFLRTAFLFKLRGDFSSMRSHLNSYLSNSGVDVTKLPPFAASVIGTMYVDIGESETAIGILENVYQTNLPRDAAANADIDSMNFMLALALAYRNTGDEESAERVLEIVSKELQVLRDRNELDSPNALEVVAANMVMHGDSEGALDVMELAADRGWRNYYFIVNDQRWSDMLSVPEFASFMAWIKADIDRKRSKVEESGANQDFRLLVDF